MSKNYSKRFKARQKREVKEAYNKQVKERIQENASGLNMTIPEYREFILNDNCDIW